MNSVRVCLRCSKKLAKSERLYCGSQKLIGSCSYKDMKEKQQDYYKVDKKVKETKSKYITCRDALGSGYF